MADNQDIRDAFGILSQRTSWVSEIQQRTFEAAVNRFFADTEEDTEPPAPVDNGLVFGSLTPQPAATVSSPSQVALPSFSRVGSTNG